MIPKIVHYCWLSNDQLPKQFQAHLDGWKRMLPDWTFMKWDFNTFDVNEYKCGVWVKEAFSVKRYAWASDPIRLNALYKYGGLYMDLDVEMRKPFSKELMESDYVLGYEYSGTIEAGVMASAPGLTWLRDCIAYYDNRHFFNEDKTHNIWPLPNIICKQLSDNGIKQVDRKSLNAVLFNGKELYILPPIYLSAKKGFDVLATDETFTIHHFAASSAKLSYILKKKLIKFIGLELTNFIISVKTFFRNIVYRQ